MKNKIIITLVFSALFAAVLACKMPQVFEPTAAPVLIPTRLVLPTRFVLPTLLDTPTQAAISTQMVSTAQPLARALPTFPGPTLVAPTQVPAPASGGLDGKALFQDRCSTCHGTGPVLRRRYSASDWKYVVDVMINQGAQLSPDEENAVVKYLAANYGQ